jgi:large subunit ribosomal protein L3
MKFLIGKKLGMTTLFNEEKGALNMTLLECETNTIVGKKTNEKDGYLAVQVMTKKTSRKNTTREFRMDKGRAPEVKIALATALEGVEVGTELSVGSFTVGEKVHISGVTKAKGFQGVVKRHGFKGAGRGHGHKHDQRKPGSIGATFPEHVVKGRRMAGRMGGANMTVKNLTVVFVDVEKKMIGVRGAVPGVTGRLVKITAAQDAFAQ